MTDIYPSKSHNGFCSSAFGPLWFTLHMVTLNYPVEPTEQQRKDFTTWFILWGKVLPCSICAKNFGDNLKDLKFSETKDMENRTTFSFFVWQLHNHINQKLKKDVWMSWENFNLFYEELRADACGANSCKIRSADLQCLLKFVKADTVSYDKICCIDATCTPTQQEHCLKPRLVKSK